MLVVRRNDGEMTGMADASIYTYLERLRDYIVSMSLWCLLLDFVSEGRAPKNVKFEGNGFLFIFFVKKLLCGYFARLTNDFML